MTTAELREKLIALYATHTVEELSKSGDLFTTAIGVDRETLVGRSDFRHLHAIIAVEKEFLELYERRYEKKHGQALGDDSARAQVVGCLKLLLNRALFNKLAEMLYKERMDVLYDLMMARFGDGNPPWAKGYRDHFKFLYEKIRDWYLFFFSYTNEGAEIINNEYRATIDGLIETKKLDQVLRSTEGQRDNNLVAEVIVQHLDRNNLPKGFYDKRNIRTGNKLDDSIRAACSTSFLFIQLVTRDSLIFREQNWPFEEYQAFKEANDQLMTQHARYGKVLQNRFLFALGGGKFDEVTPKGPQPMDYDDWYAQISHVHYQAPANDPAVFRASIDKIAACVTSFVETDWIQAV